MSFPQKSEGNLHKLPSKRKIKKMFEEDIIPVKSQAYTLNMDQYEEIKTGRKQPRRLSEDNTTTDSDIEDNVDTNVIDQITRSRTIGGHLSSNRDNNGINKRDKTDNFGEKLGKSVSHMDLEIRSGADINHLSDPVNGYLNPTRRHLINEKDIERDIHSSNREDYKISYRNAPMFENPMSSNYRHPCSSNYETKREPYDTPLRNRKYIQSNIKHHENQHVPDRVVKDINNITPKKRIEDLPIENNATREDILSRKKEDHLVVDKSSSSSKRSDIQPQQEQVNCTKGNRN